MVARQRGVTTFGQTGTMARSTAERFVGAWQRSPHVCAPLHTAINRLLYSTATRTVTVASTPASGDGASTSSNGNAHTVEVQRHTYATKGYGSHPPPRLGDVRQWTDDVIPPHPAPPVTRRIFCNRALNMKQITAVGLDMDYTLAQYKPETFEGLAHKETVNKLVDTFRYPEALRAFDFKWDFMTKGLIIDKERGNMLKVDRHNYVKLAYHGFTPLEPDSRKATYNASRSGSGGAAFDDASYAMIDTLFSLAEAYLYMQLVELKDSRQHDRLNAKTYKDLYKDLRTAVDMCHRDGSLKRAVAANPEKFIHTDDHLKHVLKSLRASGKKVFIATNSLWDYTNVVMNYLLCGKTGAAKTTEWLKYFDVVMVGCAKPAFFQYRAPLFSVDVTTGHLKNTDNGAPIIPIDEQDMSEATSPSQAPSVAVAGRASTSDSGSSSNGNGRSSAACSSSSSGAAPSSSSGAGAWGAGEVFQGGWYGDLHKMLGVTAGSQVLYVGDHIYGDIVKSKKDIGWRTFLVVPELELELEKLSRSTKMQEELRQLRELRDEADDRIQRLQWSISGNNGVVTADEQAHQRALELLSQEEERRAALKARHTALLRHHHQQFHPIWGQLMKTGHQNSRFAHQIERYACLYTSHLSNLAFVSPNKSYMGRVDLMAHEWEDSPSWPGSTGHGAHGNGGAPGPAAAPPATGKAVPAASTQ